MRLLTLSGPGGCGKTRLALEVARAGLARWPDGVWLLELGSLTDSSLIAPTLARLLDVREQRGTTLVEDLQAALREARTLLIFDNCEHVIESCADLIVRLLRSCPGLAVLATSRESLRVDGEMVWSVPPLPVPEQSARSAGAAGLASIRLFAARARLVSPTFRLNAANLSDLAEICRRLDGLPLAIELAAARVSVLSVGQIAARLDDRFGLLGSGRRSAEARQRTLRGMVEWSHALLTGAERVLLRRLAVFPASFTLETVEAICTDAELPRAELLETLVGLRSKSLVAPTRQANRYRLLETIRAFAAERLHASDEVPSLKDRHAEWCLAQAEREAEALRGPELGRALDQLDSHLDDFRAALDWSRQAQPDGTTRAVRFGPGEGLLLAATLGRFWDLSSRLGEGLRWLSELLALAPPDAGARPDALAAAGWLAYLQGDFDTTRRMHHELVRRDGADSPTRAAQFSRTTVALLACEDGQLDQAEALSRQVLDLAGPAGPPFDRAGAHWVLGQIARTRGDLTQAEHLIRESLTLVDALGDRWAVSLSLLALGELALAGGAIERAASLIRSSLVERQAQRSVWGIQSCLERMAWVAAAGGLARKASRLFGAAEQLRQATGSRQAPGEQVAHNEYRAMARSRLGEERFERGLVAGRRMRVEAAIRLALQIDPSGRRGRPDSSDSGANRGALTEREAQVARLISQGLTSRQIAAGC